jgi:glycosyltransferase involved in cell wall biosynthesis
VIVDREGAAGADERAPRATVTVKVVFFGDTPHRLAGAQRSLLASLRPIAAHGIEPLVVFPAGGTVVDAYREAGVPVRILEAPPVYGAFNKQVLGMSAARRATTLANEVLPYCRALAGVVRDAGAAAMHFNTPRGILSAGVAAKLARVPAVLHVRGAPEGFGKGLWLAAQVLATRIVLVTRALEGSVAAPFRPRCRVVWNGVDVPPPPDRAVARAGLGRRLGVTLGGETVFVSLSSLTPFKGLHHLLDAAAILRRRGVTARFVLAGGGGDSEYEAFVRRRRDELGLAQVVHLLGFVPDPLAVLAGGDALVLPSVDREQLDLGGRPVEVHGTEGLPRSILEAMSLGLPVVATRVQGVVDQVEEGRTGLIVPSGDAGRLAAGLEQAARDPAWREAAGARGREVVAARFTVDAAALGLAEALRP